MRRCSHHCLLQCLSHFPCHSLCTLLDGKETLPNSKETHPARKINPIEDIYPYGDKMKKTIITAAIIILLASVYIPTLKADPMTYTPTPDPTSIPTETPLPTNTQEPTATIPYPTEIPTHTPWPTLPKLTPELQPSLIPTNTKPPITPVLGTPIQVTEVPTGTPVPTPTKRGKYNTPVPTPTTWMRLPGTGSEGEVPYEYDYMLMFAVVFIVVVVAFVVIFYLMTRALKRQ